MVPEFTRQPTKEKTPSPPTIAEEPGVEPRLRESVDAQARSCLLGPGCGGLGGLVVVVPVRGLGRDPLGLDRLLLGLSGLDAGSLTRNGADAQFVPLPW